MWRTLVPRYLKIYPGVEVLHSRNRFMTDRHPEQKHLSSHYEEEGRNLNNVTFPSSMMIMLSTAGIWNVSVTNLSRYNISVNSPSLPTCHEISVSNYSSRTSTEIVANFFAISGQYNIICRMLNMLN